MGDLLDKGWLKHLQPEFDLEYMQRLSAFLVEQRAQGKTLYPPDSEIFAAFNATKFEQVKVVVLGQDPYHGPNQAHGLSFSVPDSTRVPPSLVNIYKEIQADLGLEKNTEEGLDLGAAQLPTSGNLLRWAQQGVLLLNSVLTVEAHQAASHQGQGWEQFTDKVIEILSRERQGIVFLLWGSYAQKKGRMIDTQQHLVLKAPHPSPLSAYRGFFGCKHFSACNQFLIEQDKVPIDWLSI